MDILELNQQALGYVRAKKWDEALGCLEAALLLDPSNPISYNNLGSLFYRQSKIDAAIEQFQKALELYPNYVDAHINIGHCYVLQENHKIAVEYYKIALELQPENLVVQHNLGMLLVQANELREAEPLLQYSYEKDNHNPETGFHLALIYAGLGDVAKAMPIYEAVLDKNPQHENAAHNLATLYLQEKQFEQSLYYYQRAADLNPQNLTAKHMSDALKGDVVEKAPRAYVESLFDQYAPSYNTHVKGVLQYQVPQHIRRLLTPYMQKLSAQSVGIDLGCGTGLMAPYVQDVIGKLIGVDVSLSMLKVAEEQGGYDTLIHNDIVEALKDFKKEVDLMVAADVFVYLGQLESLFEASASALRPQGLFAFSIEVSETASVQLKHSGRFAHSIEYIQKLSEQYGFALLASEACALREDEGRPIQGQVFVLEMLGIE